MKELFFSWGMLIISVLFNAYGVFVIKLKLNEYGPVPAESLRAAMNYFLLLLKTPLVVSGVVLFFLSPFLFTVALSRMEIAVAYPAQIGLNFLILLLLAVLILGEQLNGLKILGIALILLGVIVLNKTGVQ